MNTAQETRALRILAKLAGWTLAIDTYDPIPGRNSEGSNFPLPKSAVVNALRSLEGDGLVASIYERLDGPQYALTAKGRKLMEEEGFRFDQAHVARTQQLFRSYLCKAEV